MAYTAANKNHEYSIDLQSNTYVHYARNKAVYQAAQMDADYLMFIDSDMEFPADGIDHLLSLEMDIVGGLYFSRNSDFPIPIILEIKNNTTHKYIKYPQDTDLFEVDAVGTGFMLIDMDVFKKIDPPYFYHTTPKEFKLNEHSFPDNEIGEDVAFCLKAKEAGFKIMCDSSIKLGHIGSKVHTQADYKRWLKEEYEKFKTKKQQSPSTGAIE